MINTNCCKCNKCHADKGCCTCNCGHYCCKPGPRGPVGPQGVRGAQGSTGKQGLTGKNGKSAYEVAVDNGYKGTEAEWLNNLQGEAGPQGLQGLQGLTGAKGKSAYQEAVDKGYKGTETEWLSSLQGEPGPQGQAGLAATISVESSSRVPFDDEPYVVNVGTTQAAILKFGIPAGMPGEKGTAGNDGKSAYEVAVDNGYKGTETEWLNGLKGATGSQGAIGISPNITIGTVSTGAPGSSAGAAITGTTPNLTLNLTIPGTTEAAYGIVTSNTWETATVSSRGTVPFDSILNNVNTQLTDNGIQVMVSGVYQILYRLNISSGQNGAFNITIGSTQRPEAFMTFQTQGGAAMYSSGTVIKLNAGDIVKVTNSSHSPIELGGSNTNATKTWTFGSLTVVRIA